MALEFNDDLGRSVFKLIDSTTGEVLRQIPSEEALAVARALAGGKPAGALLDARV
ncbi:MAG TPA: flagellar protein FlaG [Burkholderiaceae bacterium]|nr:flagellar protein FlaG [Burkholderiaceae bacterium]